MAIACQTLNVLAPANITATDMVLGQTSCQAPCNTTVTITWRNIGDGAGNFEPAVVVNGIRTAGATQQLAGGAEYTEIFNLVDLPASVDPYIICPDPN